MQFPHCGRGHQIGNASSNWGHTVKSWVADGRRNFVLDAI